MKTSVLFVAALLVLHTTGSLSAAPSAWSVAVEVELGEDIGQNYGTLFEVVDSEGNVIAGAGFVGSYNTQSRSDRRGLQFFVKSKRDSAFKPKALPRPTADAGTYLFDFEGQLYSKGRGGKDRQLRRWQPKKSQWEVDNNTAIFSVPLADGVLSSDARGVCYKGKTVLEVKPEQGSFAERYYANGQIVFRRFDPKATPPINELIACPWKSSQSAAVSWQEGLSIKMGTPNEFVYAYGQLEGQVVAATNTGGLYVFDGSSWKTILEPDTTVSFQIYTMINYGDRLLMGQYPTGELFAYDGQKLEHLPEWPPAMPGVRKQASEAQSLTIYGGDLYAGIWPWGEVWKYRGPSSGWTFCDRVFTHPVPTDKTTHPYEEETKQFSKVANLWGQRVTSLIPLGDSLYVSTSSKGGNPYESKLTFLAGDKWKQYGAVYQYQHPGALVVPTKWTPGPTRFEFQLRQDELRVLQDGLLIGSARAPKELAGDLATGQVAWGKGVFGPLRGKIISRPQKPLAGNKAKSLSQNHIGGVQRPEKSGQPIGFATCSKKPLIGAYIDMHACFDRKDSHADARRKIDSQLDQFCDSGFNTIMPKCTTSSGRANYPSTIISGQTYPNWDPLEHFIAGARQRGLDVWPTVCMMVCGHDKPRGILLEHPEWAMRSIDGKPIGYISPGHPEARKWIVAFLEEIVRNYQPDGLVLDYMRYHNRPIQLDEYSTAQFEQELAAIGEVNKAQRKKHLQAFRERLLTELMGQIQTSLRQLKPDLKLSIYTWGPHVLENHRVAQDWQTWVERGYLDMINVSGYLYPEKNGEDYLAKLEDKLSTAKAIVDATGRPIPVTFALGVRTSHGEVKSAEQISDILKVAKRANLDGVAVFTWAYLQPWLDDVVKSGNLLIFNTDN